ncbi:MAG: cation:proton antiporter [Prevotella sp.]|nr:cation:proton antiporter [Prevotella sp.]
MSQLEPLIADLALILICAGAMTLLFKRLKQPVVLGYIVAGFLASPNMPYMPSVTDLDGIHLWSEIGVIFLLFSLGLEFSFRKILRMGATPIIAACAVIMGLTTDTMVGEQSTEKAPSGDVEGALWRVYFKRTVLNIFIYSVLCMALIALVLYFGKPFLADYLPKPWTHIVTALCAIILCAPFLWMLMRQGNRSADVMALWNSGRASRVKLVAFQLLRFVIAAAFVSYILGHTVRWSGMLGIFVVLAIVFSIVFSPRLQRQGERMAKTFNENLNQREQGA